MLTNQLEAFSIPAYIFLFIVLWICVCQLISTAGGWRRLSLDYRAAAPFDGKKLWFKSAGMRYWTNYNNCLIVGANPYGLYLAVLPIFRVGHPPLFISWAEISTEAGSRRFFGDFVKFKFARQPDVPVLLSKKLAARILRMKAAHHLGFGVSPE
jgi:hypothetical protein